MVEAEEVIAQGGGAIGAAVGRSEAAVRARREQGRAAGRTLWGAVETGGGA